MPVDNGHPQQWISIVVTIVIISAVLALRVRRMHRTRPLQVDRLWIFPAVYLLIASVMLYEFPPVGLQWLLCGLALAIGAALGWQRGRMMQIHVDPDTGELVQRASPAAIFFLLGLIGVRFGLRELAAGGGGPLHLNTLALTDMLVLFALGLFTAQRVEMYLRAKAMLRDTGPAAA